MPIAEFSGTDVLLHPAGPLFGTPMLPASKSLANRYLACAALADGTSELTGATLSDDVEAMLGALRQLGIGVVFSDRARRITVTGCAGHLPEEEADLDVGAAGTAMRFLTALVCLGRGRYRLDGSARMRQRPIADEVDALRDLGAQIGYEAVLGCPPLNIQAVGLLGGTVVLRTPPSSQFLSALLMAAPYAQQDVFIEIQGPLVSQPYVALTIDVQRSLGVEIVNDDFQRFIVPAPQRYRAGTFAIEPDASAATYFWAAAAITGGSVTVEGLTRSSLQGDTGFVDVLARMGCKVSETADSLTVAAPAGRLQGIDVDLNAQPDTVQTLAFTALFAEGPTLIRNVANLRVKETDRLAALATELSKLGAHVELTADGLVVTPPPTIRPAALDTYEDHRMAMSGALAGLVAPGVKICNAGVVSKSFPGYFAALNALRETQR